MSGKRGKGGKTKGGSKNSDGDDTSGSKVFALPPEVERLTRQLNADKLDVLSSRYEALQKENLELRARIAKGERDTHEFVAYFQRELEGKEDAIGRRRAELASTSAQLHADTDAERKANAATTSEMEARSAEEGETQRARIAMLEDELSKLRTFKSRRREIESHVDELKEQLRAHKLKHGASLKASAAKWERERVKMQEDLEERSDDIHRAARMEMQRGLDGGMRKIIGDNRRMGEELRFQQMMCDELGEDTRKVQEDNAKHRADMARADKTESETAYERHVDKVDMRRLVERKELLEEALEACDGRFKAERRRLKVEGTAEVEELALDAASARSLLELKNREINNISALMKTIMAQRTDTEAMFIGVLDDAKQAIRDQRQRKHRAELKAWRRATTAAAADAATAEKPASRAHGPFNGQSGTFSLTGVEHDENGIGKKQQRRGPEAGTASAAAATTGAGPLPTAPSDDIDISTFSWGEREDVMRRLFTIINQAEITARQAASESRHRQEKLSRGSSGKPGTPGFPGATQAPATTAGLAEAFGF